MTELDAALIKLYWFYLQHRNIQVLDEEFSTQKVPQDMARYYR